LPTIPAQVIGYALAREILLLFDTSTQADAAWQGGLNITYYIGGKLKDDRLKLNENKFTVK
jgi:hypothetical protein